MPERADLLSSAPLTQPALERWGRTIGESAASGDLPLPLTIAFRGPLGAGKSVLARAIARGAGVAGPMPSPTYNLLFTYEAAGGLTVNHLDLYRLEDPEDVWELGWRELGEGRQLVLVEWPERAESLMPGDRWDVTLEFVEGSETERRLVFERLGAAPGPPAPVPGPDGASPGPGPRGRAAEPPPHPAGAEEAR